MPYKVTLVFNQSTGTGGGGTGTETRVAGWTESVWTSESVLANVFTQLFGPGATGTPLCIARAFALPAEGAIVGQRIAAFDVNLKRLGKAQTLNRFFPGGNHATDIPTVALQCTSPSASSVNVRHFAIRDIPDDQITFGEYTPDFGYDATIQSYLNTLANWQFLGQDLTVPSFPINTIDTAGNLTTVGPAGFVVGDTIQYRKTKRNLSGLVVSGTALVLSIDGVTGMPKITWPSGVATTGGTVRKYVPRLFTMSPTPLATVVRAVTRKVGRPFGQFRGRRSKKKVS